VPIHKRKKKKSDPVYKMIEVQGVDDATPNSCTIKHKDWVCWINPSAAKSLTISWVTKHPLKDAHGHVSPPIVVPKGGVSCWYQFKGGVSKGDHFEYHVLAKKKWKKGKKKGGNPVQAPGPEIIAGD